jgi:ribosomal protein S18 acetylase RimI-like enzyme
VRQISIDVVPHPSPELVAKLTPAFMEAFNGPFWGEQWDDPSTTDYLTKLFGTGAALVLAQDASTECASFVVGLPLSQYEGEAEMIEQGASKGAYYIAEVVTAESHRQRGLAELLVSVMLTSIKFSHPVVVYRTRSDNEPMKKLARRLGFQEIGRYEATSGGVKSERIVFQHS